MFLCVALSLLSLLCEALALSARASLRNSLTAPIYVSISVLPQPYISTCVVSQCYDPVWCNTVVAIEFERESSLTAPIYVLSISILPQHHISTCASSRFFNLVWCNKVFANFKRRVLSQLQHMLVYQSCRNHYIFIRRVCLSSKCYDPVWRKIVIAVLKGDFSSISNLCMFINPALTLHIDVCFFSKLWSSFV